MKHIFKLVLRWGIFVPYLARKLSVFHVKQFSYPSSLEDSAPALGRSNLWFPMVFWPQRILEKNSSTLDKFLCTPLIGLYYLYNTIVRPWLGCTIYTYLILCTPLIRLYYLYVSYIVYILAQAAIFKSPKLQVMTFYWS